MIHQVFGAHPGVIRKAATVLVRAFFMILCAGALAAGCLAQRGSGSMTIVTPGSGQNILYGDVRVDEGKTGDTKPMTFTIVLSMAGGTVIGRQTVGNGQRYRFNDLADGDYDVVVELENRQITRDRVRLYSQPSVGKTDVRHDIELELRPTGVTGKAKPLQFPRTMYTSELMRISNCLSRLRKLRTKRNTINR